MNSFWVVHFIEFKNDLYFCYQFECKISNMSSVADLYYIYQMFILLILIAYSIKCYFNLIYMLL